MQNIHIISHGNKKFPLGLSDVCDIRECFKKDTSTLSGYTWESVKKRMSDDLDRVLRNPLVYPVEIDLSCHNSIAYLAGSKFRTRLMDDNVNLYTADIVLCNPSGSKFSLCAKASSNPIELHTTTVKPSKVKNDTIGSVALVLEIGRNKEALSKAKDFLKKASNDITIIQCKYANNVGGSDDFLAIHNAISSLVASYSIIHLFGYSPVQLFFLLGADWRRKKAVYLYEYLNGMYVPSFKI